MNMSKAIYPTEPLKCWKKAKELREKYYRDYAKAHELGGLRWAGSAVAFDALPAALGDDVYPLTGEPYGASCSLDSDYSRRCMEAAEQAGYPRDVCAYMRNYWGSILRNEYAFGGPFQKPDFLWTIHLCCTHGKWYQEVSRLEGGLPYFVVDFGAGPFWEWDESIGQYQFKTEGKEHRLQYMVDQLQEGIEFLEKTTGRKVDDEKLIEAVHNTCESTSLWAQICALNKAVPAPLDEKTMYSLYVFAALQKSKKEFVELYRELKDEVEDRVARGIAAIPNERARIMTDIQPPWPFLKIYRYLEEYGCVAIGSLYSFALIAIWQIEKDGTLNGRDTPLMKGIEIKNREQALWTLADWNMSQFMATMFYSHRIKSDLMIKIARQWKADGAILHFNRGCEGLTLGVAENKLALAEAGIPVATYEGNMGDEREFDFNATQERIDSFMEAIGLK